MEFPKSSHLEKLLEQTQKETGKVFLFRDIQEHPNKAIRNRFGRYERSKDTIWIRTGLPSYVETYVKAHELCHALQQARGYSSVSLREGFKTVPCPDIVMGFHGLAGLISDVVLDPGADAMAKDTCGLDKNALSYLCDMTALPHGQRILADFDGKQFYADLEVLCRAELDKRVGLSPSFPGLFHTVADAATYANLRIRFSPYGLFDKLESAWAQCRQQAHALGAELTNIALAQRLDTLEGCKQAEIKLIEHLHIPNEVFGIRAQDKWIWPYAA